MDSNIRCSVSVDGVTVCITPSATHVAIGGLKEQENLNGILTSNFFLV